MRKELKKNVSAGAGLSLKTKAGRIFLLKMPKTHELTGQIISKEPRKVYDKKSPYCGNLVYKLRIISENSQLTENCFVYPNLVDRTILKTIEQSRYIDQ